MKIRFQSIVQICSGDDPVCNQCKDQDGNPCNDVIRRFSNTRFWLMKGDKTGSFNEAVETCQRLGFEIAEINSEADQSNLEKLGSCKLNICTYYDSSSSRLSI